MVLLHHVMVVVPWQRTHQAEVSDFDEVVGGQQDVSCGQVSVDEAA